MCTQGNKWDTTMTRKAAVPWFCGAQEDWSTLQLSDGTRCDTVWDVKAVWHCGWVGKEPIGCSTALQASLLGDERGDALHTTLFDNRLQTHFNVAHEWVGGAEWGPRGRRRRDLKWCDFWGTESQQYGGGAIMEMFFYYALTLSWRHDWRAWSSWTISTLRFLLRWLQGIHTMPGWGLTWAPN